MDTQMTLPPPPAAVTTPNPVLRALRAPFEARTWRETFHLLFNLPVGIATFTVVVTGFATGLGMLITLLGIPIIFATMYLSRWMASIERGRARLFLGVEVPPAYRPDPPPDKWWRAHVARFTDPATWVETGYHLLMLPFGIFTFTLVVTFWSLAIGLLTAPFYGWALPQGLVLGSDLDRWLIVDTPLEYSLTVLAGAVVLLATPWIVRGLGEANRMMVRGMLGIDPAKRVQALTETRAAAVDLAAEDRRRIERDLHDGVQQRLVALAMDLGRAKEKMDTDPDRARELVTEAHEEAKLAITEVRDLARGIHPAVLTDRGLDAALSALAARSTVPVAVSVDVPARPPASVEAAAYFVVSEALANVVKHAKASAAAVTVRRVDDRLTVQVQDDGVGGASVVEGSGLAGLRDRVQALDGELHLLSPEGGPTVLMAEIPCVS
ncbi:MAG TPA: sensor histidine kinase [Actinomycetota bacterium]|nr:sensor histidine kinase [Actinomycetota bacterium]